jgi:phosphatidate phosphatase APP1
MTAGYCQSQAVWKQLHMLLLLHGTGSSSGSRHSSNSGVTVSRWLQQLWQQMHMQWQQLLQRLKQLTMRVSLT